MRDGKNKADVVVLGTYSSGMIPETLIPQIKKLKESDVPVFAVRDEIFSDNEMDILRLEKDTLSFMPQPKALSAGLVPLQGYPLELYQIADDMRAFFGKYLSYLPLAKSSITLGENRARMGELFLYNFFMTMK